MIKRGKDVPEWTNRPILFEDLQRIWEAFWILHRSRRSSISGSPEPISVSEMIAYAKCFNIPVKRFVDAVQILDNEFMICIAEARKTKEGTNR